MPAKMLENFSFLTFFVLFGLLIGVSPLAIAKETGANLDLFASPKVNKAKATQPPLVQLLEPKALSRVDGSSTDLRWEPLEGIQVYQVQVATDPNFKWFVKDEHSKDLNLFNVTETKLHLDHLEPGKHYFWRVAARKPDNEPSYTKGYFVMSSFETADAAAHQEATAHE